MKLVIESLNRDIIDLRSHIEFTENLQNDILPTSKNYIYSKSSTSRKFEYNAIIISLYGIIEHYIEQISYSYLELVEKNIPFYDNLDRKFTENHFNLSIQLINKVIENKHIKYSKLSKETILANLNDCLVHNLDFTLNKEAFTINTGNLKHAKICETINYMNINLDTRLRLIDGFYSNSENGFNKIDELVQRRNEIAHGNIQDILDVSEIIPFIDFIERYLQAICQILTEEITDLTNRFNKKHFGVLIEPIIMFKGNIIGIPDGKKLNIKIGDEILIERNDGRVFTCKALNLKEFEDNSVTIKINRNTRENHKFFIYNKASHQPQNI